MLIPKERDQLIRNDSIADMEPESKELPANPIKEISNGPSLKVLRITKLIPSENNLVNGNVNGEAKPPSKCMNILQNIIIKKEDQDNCIQIPIKREMDDDNMLHHRIKVPRRDNNNEATMASTSIKEEVLDIKSEVVEALANNAVENEAAANNKTVVHSCFSCNMIFLEKEEFKAHSKQCRKIETNYTPAVEQTSSSGNLGNGQFSGKPNNYLQHLDQLPRLIESIRSTPCLYDTNIEGFNNVELKDQMWSQIGANCNFVSGKIAKGTWKKLLQEFRDSMTKRQNGALAEPYRFEQQMQFMLPYVENVKPTIHNESYTSSYSTHGNFTGVISNEIIEDVDDAQSIIHIASPPKRPRISTPYMIRPNNNSQTQQQPPPNSDRAIDLFFMSMCESAKILPANLQLQVKRKIFESVFEAEEIANRVNQIRNEPFSPPRTPDDDFQY